MNTTYDEEALRAAGWVPAAELQAAQHEVNVLARERDDALSHRGLYRAPSYPQATPADRLVKLRDDVTYMRRLINKHRHEGNTLSILEGVKNQSRSAIITHDEKYANNLRSAHPGITAVALGQAEEFFTGSKVGLVFDGAVMEILLGRTYEMTQVALTELQRTEAIKKALSDRYF